MYKIKVEIERKNKELSLKMRYSAKEKAERYYFSVVYIICCVNMMHSLTKNKTLDDVGSGEVSGFIFKADTSENEELFAAVTDCILDFAKDRADTITVEIKEGNVNGKE